MRYTTLKTLMIPAAIALTGTAHADLSVGAGLGVNVDLSGIKIGADSETSMESQFKAFDQNNNGFVSKSEASSNAQLAGLYSRLDVNADGKLTMDEYTSQLQARAKGAANPMRDRAADMRAQGEGRVSAGTDSANNAAASVRAEGQARVDSTRNRVESAGAETRAQAEARARQVQSTSAETAAEAEARARASMAARANAGVALSTELAGKFTSQDRNNDGLISKAEASGEAKANFDAGDSNNDGFLTKAEFKAAVEAEASGGFMGWVRGIFG